MGEERRAQAIRDERTDPRHIFHLGGAEVPASLLAVQREITPAVAPAHQGSPQFIVEPEGAENVAPPPTAVEVASRGDRQACRPAWPGGEDLQLVEICLLVLDLNEAAGVSCGKARADCPADQQRGGVRSRSAPRIERHGPAQLRHRLESQGLGIQP